MRDAISFTTMTVGLLLSSNAWSVSESAERTRNNDVEMAESQQSSEIHTLPHLMYLD